MDEWEQDVDERCGGEQRVHESEDGAQPPAALVDGDEDCVVNEREEETGDEVERVAERFGAQSAPSAARSD